MVKEVGADQLNTPLAQEISANDYQRLAELLLEAIPDDRKREWPGRVMIYLAEQAIKCATRGEMPASVPTKAIHADLGGNPNKEPSGWLSPIWKEIENRHYPEIQQSLANLCRRAGLNVYPVLEKEDGSPARYRLAAKALPPSSSTEGGNEEALPPHTIRYKPDLAIGLSWLGRLLFNQGLTWTPTKRYSYLAWQLLFLIGSVLFVSLIWLILMFRKTPVTGQDLALIIMGIGTAWATYWHFHKVFRLFDDRIMIAPDWALSWKETGATIEINRSKDPDVPNTIVVKRYTATCPQCGWMVKLDKGEPDFPRRIIGRCEENPMEHIFSFDRSTKLGIPLRSDHCNSPKMAVIEGNKA